MDTENSCTSDEKGFIFQKASVAVALAVLRIKPPNLSTRQFVTMIRNDIEEKSNNAHHDTSERTQGSQTQVTDSFDGTNTIDCSYLSSCLNLSQKFLRKCQGSYSKFRVIQAMDHVKKFLDGHIDLTSSRGQNWSQPDSGCIVSETFSATDSKEGDRLNDSGLKIVGALTSGPRSWETSEYLLGAAGLLGRLVDRGHRRGLYLPYLDEVFDRIREALDALDDVSQEHPQGAEYKQYNISTLLLLTESKHMLTHVITLLLKRLSSFHAELTKPDTFYDIENPKEFDNTFYLFHLLEQLLMKLDAKKSEANAYEDVKNIEFDQNSDAVRNIDFKNDDFEDCIEYSERDNVETNDCKILEDVWRKKWIPNYDEGKHESEIKAEIDRDVEAECVELLNKLILDCMDNYQLISLTALECRNILMPEEES